MLKRCLSNILIKNYRWHRLISLHEVEKHKAERWIIIDDDVYCLASMRNHSGDLHVIGELAGRDVTQIFYQVHLKSTILKQSLYPKYWIGKTTRNMSKEESNYYLKEKLINHTWRDCNIPNLASPIEESVLKEQFQQYINSVNFPCLSAKISVLRKSFSFALYDMLAGEDTTQLLWHRLIDFINCQSSLWASDHMFTTYVACFRAPTDMSETVFERLLWKQLQQLHQIDVQNGMKWNDNYSDDPIHPDFGFSVGGRAFFIVGLHPNSSRRAQQFVTPTITFNSLDQFQNFRRLALFNTIQHVIRNNDLIYNQSINPNLTSEDNKSAAFEYSGKLIQSNWIPPFKSLHYNTWIKYIFSFDSFLQQITFIDWT